MRNPAFIDDYVSSALTKNDRDVKRSSKFIWKKTVKNMSVLVFTNKPIFFFFHLFFLFKDVF